jgi:membrane protease YdiL (CAAX protease family)
MRDRFKFASKDADITALRLEHFTAMLETVLVFAIFYLIQQWLASRGWFERALEMPGSLGAITTHLGWIIATVLGLFALPFFLRWISEGRKLSGFGFARKPGRRTLSLASYLGVLMGLWFSVGFWLRSDALADARSMLAINTVADALFYIFYVALIASALRQEFFFRGYIQRLLTREYGISWGTLLALLFFWVSLSWIGWFHVVTLMVPLGLCSALLFNRRKSIYAPLLFHGLAFSLGFAGYAVFELIPGGYAFYTSILCLIVIVMFPRMRMPLLVLLRELWTLVVGLRSNLLRNILIAATMVVAVRVLWITAHRNFEVHAIGTLIFVLIYIGYKIGERFFILRRVLEQ